MKKEQITIRVLPVININLEKERQAKGFKNVNDYINTIIENHILKKDEKEKIDEKIIKRLEELEESFLNAVKENATDLENIKKLLIIVAKKVSANSEIKNETVSN